MSFELVLGLLTLFGTAAIGMPVAYAIIIGVLVYLGLAGQDSDCRGNHGSKAVRWIPSARSPAFHCLCKYNECGIDLGPSASLLHRLGRPV